MNKLIILLALALLLTNPATVQAQNFNDYPEYVIQPGDSLGYIARLFDTSVNAIVDLNNIPNPDLISPGEIIKIPGLQGISGRLEVVTLQLGERFSYMPAKFGAQIDDIIRLNNLLTPTLVFPGTYLIIPASNPYNLLIPVMWIEENTTGLESAVRTGFNPHTLNLQNLTTNLNTSPAGTVLFSKQTSALQPINLFFPALQNVKLYPLPLVQGSTEVVAVQSEYPVSLHGSLGEYKLNFYNDAPGQYFSLQGIHALAEPGLVEFKLTGTFENGSTQAFSQMVLLKPGDFDEDPPLIVDPETLDPSITEPENELVLSLITQKNPKRYWIDIFSSPAVYQEYNSLFGTRRWYNDDPQMYFHSGVDFAGGMTLPIKAPAPGVVVFAGPLTVRGNAVFIDHGWGVFSGFFHQDTLTVKVGDKVDSGTIIGTVGNTGRVNGAGDYLGAGAHLHWEVWVNEVQVDPLAWLYSKYP